MKSDTRLFYKLVAIVLALVLRYSTVTAKVTGIERIHP